MTVREPSEDLVLSIFSKLGLEPRSHQIEAILKILRSFQSGKKNVVLSAPTGSGKSVIGVVVSECLAQLVETEDSGLKTRKGLYLTGTITLTQQYERSFSGKFPFLEHKGASNYSCAVAEKGLFKLPDGEKSSAEHCTLPLLRKKGHVPADCETCLYNINKKLSNTIDHLATNYAFFITERLNGKQRNTRLVTVWDEAHLFNELFCSGQEINLSTKTLDRAKHSAEAYLVGETQQEQLKKIKDLRHALTSPTLGEDNYGALFVSYKEFLGHFKYLLEKSVGFLEDKQETTEGLDDDEEKLYLKLSKEQRFWFGNFRKLRDLFEIGYPHVFELKDREAIIKPIFAASFFGKLVQSPFNLFMSGTIDEAYVRRSFGFSDEEFELIKLPPVFPPENKLVCFYDRLTLNYNSLKDPKTIERLASNLWSILDKHSKLGEKGIIQTPSFYLQEELLGMIDGALDDCYFFVQNKGEPLQAVLERFKAYKGGSAVLFSPSIFEGIDLPDDDSRFQIMVKAPFPSLGDKRIHKIADEWPDFYESMTLMKLVQGLGRSSRSETDKSITYFLDTQQYRLFFSRANIWKDESQVVNL